MNPYTLIHHSELIIINGQSFFIYYPPPPICNIQCLLSYTHIVDSFHVNFNHNFTYIILGKEMKIYNKIKEIICQQFYHKKFETGNINMNHDIFFLLKKFIYPEPIHLKRI